MNEIERQNPDLIVMVRNAGRHWLPAWLKRELADVVISAGVAPVLLVPNAGSDGRERDVPLSGRSVIVPLDGSTVDDATLSSVCVLAGRLEEWSCWHKLSHRPSFRPSCRTPSTSMSWPTIWTLPER